MRTIACLRSYNRLFLSLIHYDMPQGKERSHAIQIDISICFGSLDMVSSLVPFYNSIVSSKWSKQVDARSRV